MSSFCCFPFPFPVAFRLISSPYLPLLYIVLVFTNVVPDRETATGRQKMPPHSGSNAAVSPPLVRGKRYTSITIIDGTDAMTR